MEKAEGVLVPTTEDLVSTALSKCGFSTDRPPKTPTEKRKFVTLLKKEASAFMESKGDLPLGNDAVSSIREWEITAEKFLRKKT